MKMAKYTSYIRFLISYFKSKCSTSQVYNSMKNDHMYFKFHYDFLLSINFLGINF